MTTARPFLLFRAWQLNLPRPANPSFISIPL